MITDNTINKDLLEKANTARKASIILAESIYKYIGGIITKSDLKEIVDSVISDDYTVRFKHMYILKDTYDDYLGSNLSPDDLNVLEDDTETFNVIEEGEN